MYVRTSLIVLVVPALALFTAANWQAFTTPTTLSMIFAAVETPLGLILRGMVMLLAPLFLVYVVYLQSSVLFETRRYAASYARTHELGAALETQLQTLAEQTEQSKAELAANNFRRFSTLPASSTSNDAPGNLPPTAMRVPPRARCNPARRDQRSRGRRRERNATPAAGRFL